MDKIKRIKTQEQGQILPIVVIGVLIIFAMAALILDGGGLLLNRRSAQAAADAGALAGARELCYSESECHNKGFNPAKCAEYYSITLNHATFAEATVVEGVVNVKATMQQDSFFAKIFNQDQLTSVAEAEAGCLAPAGAAVVPLAWNCRAPTVGGGPFDPDKGCQIQTLSWSNLLEPLVKGQVGSISIDGTDYFINATYHKSITDSAGIPPRQIYIVIDSDKICYEDDPVTSAIICDLDGDGKKDIQTGGNRGWLYLTGDTNNISDWITNTPPFETKAHMWLSGKGGGVVDVYKDMLNYDYQGKVVLVPVYNTLCSGESIPGDQCMADAHDPLYWPPEPPGGDDFSQIRNKENYHIVAFEPFYITCISKKGNCPGANRARALDSDFGDIPSLEGFFLTDVDLTLASSQSCVVNLGNCVVSLTK